MLKSKNLFVSIFFLILFLLTLMEYYSNYFFNIDFYFNNIHNESNNATFTFISKGIHYLFDPTVVLVILILFAFYLYKYVSKKEAKYLVVFTLIVAFLIVLLKNLIHRLRPANMMINETSFAFPSGHSITGVILFGLIYYYLLRLGFLKSTFSRIGSFLLTLGLVFLVGASRIYLNVHYFSDVLAGLIIGTFLLFGFLFYIEKDNGKKK